MSTFEYYQSDYLRHRRAFVAPNNGLVGIGGWETFEGAGERLPDFVACLAAEILLSQAVYTHFPQQRTAFLAAAGIPRMACNLNAGYPHYLLECDRWDNRFPAKALNRPLLCAMVIMFRRFKDDMHRLRYAVGAAELHRALVADPHVRKWAELPWRDPIRQAYEAIGLAFEVVGYLDRH